MAQVKSKIIKVPDPDGERSPDATLEEKFDGAVNRWLQDNDIKRKDLIDLHFSIDNRERVSGPVYTILIIYV